jgi:hypothetical protein
MSKKIKIGDAEVEVPDNYDSTTHDVRKNDDGTYTVTEKPKNNATDTASKDDKAKDGSFSRVRGSITGHVAPNGDWSAFDREDGKSVTYGDIKQLDTSAGASAIGMVDGKASETAEIPPVIQRSLGAPDEVQVENHVWMPKTEGLY